MVPGFLDGSSVIFLPIEGASAVPNDEYELAVTYSVWAACCAAWRFDSTTTSVAWMALMGPSTACWAPQPASTAQATAAKASLAKRRRRAGPAAFHGPRPSRTG